MITFKRAQNVKSAGTKFINENERNQPKNNKFNINNMLKSIRLIGRRGIWLGTWRLGTSPATWRARCARVCALLGRPRSRRPHLHHPACAAAGSSSLRCCYMSWGARDSSGELRARMAAQRAPEAPGRPVAAEPSAPARRSRS